MESSKPLTVLILSAGKGTRMKSDLAKVLHEVGGRPMLEYVLDVSGHLGPERTIVVVGHQAERVEALAGGRAECTLQEPQLGTGHAVMCAAPCFEDSGGTLLMLYGDVPLISIETIRSLLYAHEKGNHSATVLTAVLEDPAGYGRIIRGPGGMLDRIVEHKDASEEEKAVREINTGICCFEISDLIPVLNELSNDNSQGEYYITDAMEHLNRRGLPVGAVVAQDPVEVEGINTVEQLARAERLIAAMKKT